MTTPTWTRDLDRHAAEEARKRAAKRTLAAARDQTVVMYRICSQGASWNYATSLVYGYTADYAMALWSENHRAAAFREALTAREDIDFRRGYDYYPQTGEVRLSPRDPEEPGFIPGEDLTFGGTPVPRPTQGETP